MPVALKVHHLHNSWIKSAWAVIGLRLRPPPAPICFVRYSFGLFLKQQGPVGEKIAKAGCEAREPYLWPSSASKLQRMAPQVHVSICTKSLLACLAIGFIHDLLLSCFVTSKKALPVSSSFSRVLMLTPELLVMRKSPIAFLLPGI